MSDYGNSAWQWFVYGSYVFVACVVVVFAIYALKVRNSSLKSLLQEGFLENKEDQ